MVIAIDIIIQNNLESKLPGVEVGISDLSKEAKRKMISDIVAKINNNNFNKFKAEVFV